MQFAEIAKVVLQVVYYALLHNLKLQAPTAQFVEKVFDVSVADMSTMFEIRMIVVKNKL